MPKATPPKRQVQRVRWPWDDRGRSALTADDVRQSLAALSALLPQVMCRVHSARETGPVVVNGEVWR